MLRAHVEAALGSSSDLTDSVAAVTLYRWIAPSELRMPQIGTVDLDEIDSGGSQAAGDLFFDSADPSVPGTIQPIGGS